MIAQRHPQLLRTAPAVAIARSRAADGEAALLLALLVLAGLLWLVVGAAVMRGAPAPEGEQGARAHPSLQGGLADLQALASD